MPKRSGRDHKNLVVRVIVVAVLSISVSLLSFGCGYSKKFEIDNYDDFIHNLIHYDDKDDYEVSPKPDNPDDSKLTENPIVDPNGAEDPGFMQIHGFELLIKDSFISAEKFYDGYAFVKPDEEKNYLINNEGDLFEISENLSNIETVKLKYVTHNSEFYGVKSIFGEIIVEEVYDSIEINGNSILAITGNTAVVFCDGVKISGTKFDHYVMLLSDSYILKDDIICDLHFNEMKVDGYRYKNVPSDGIVIVNIGEGFYAYASIEDQKIICGPFIVANRFINGFATAQMPNGTFVVISTDGSTVYGSESRIVGSKSGRYFCFMQNSLYGVMDEDFNEILKPTFTEVIDEQAIGDCLSVRHGSGVCLYSLIDGEFVTDAYDSIIYEDGIYICFLENKCVVINAELQIIAECEFAAYSDGILLVKADGKYSYYKRCINE